MSRISKIITSVIVVLIVMSNFAGAVPAMADANESFLQSYSQSSESSANDFKLMHRSIDYKGGTPADSSIIPYYESQSASPSAEDLAFDHSTEQTYDTKKSAEKNLDDAAVMYSFVHNNFKYVPYFGSMKGSHLTYMDRGGNDVDQASLLISLLRTSNISAKYVHGTIELTNEQAMNYLNVENNSIIVDLLNKNGIPAISTGTGVQFEHVWVEAYVNETWVALDPSYKQYTYVYGIDLNEIALNQSGFNDILGGMITSSRDDISSINTSNLKASFETLVNNTNTLLDTKYANASNEELFGSKKIIQYTDYYSLPSTLPYTVSKVHGQYASLPDSFNHKIGIELAGINVTLDTAEVAGKRISILYEPSTKNDADNLNSSANLGDINASNVNMSAVLRIDGEIRSIGSPAILGSDQDLTLSFISPEGQIDSYDRVVQTGAYFVIGLALQPVSTAHMNERVKRYEVTSDLLDLDYFNVTKDEIYGEMLNLQSLTFWGNYGLYNLISSGVMNVVYTRHPSAMLIGTELNVTDSGDARKVEMTGVYTDIIRDVINPTSRTGNADDSYTFLFTRGMTASSMEKSMLELSYDVTSYSTTDIIKIAGESGIEIYTINNVSAWDSKNASLNISSSQKTIIKNAVDAGYTVITPASNVTVGNFTGSAFIVLDPKTGASSYYGPNGRGWGWLDTIKTGLEAGISAAGTVVKGAASTIADVGGKIAGVAAGVISTVGEAVNGVGSTAARVAKTVVVGAVNAAGYVVTTVLPTVAVGVTAATVAGLVVVTAFTADRLTELGKTVVDIVDTNNEYKKSVEEYREIQEKLKDKKEQTTEKDLEDKKKEIDDKKEELDDKIDDLKENEDIDLDPETDPDPEPPGDDPEPEPPGDDPEPEPPGDDPEPEPPGDDPEPEPPGDDPEPEPPGDDPEAEEPDLEDDIDDIDDLEPDDDPDEPSSPGGDHPDDTFSVASANLRNADVTSLLIRESFKKNNTNAILLNDYRVGQIEMDLIFGYDTNDSQLYDLSASQARTYTDIVKNYDKVLQDLETAPNVLMLKKGFYASAKSMLEKMNVPIRLMRVQDFATSDTQELLNNNSILFLPSGSLYGLDSSKLIKDKLEDYVASGGTIIVMAQQHGYEFNMLPYNGSKMVSGAGWQEDQSCLYNAASISEYHPVLSGQPRSSLTVNIDGYFTSYPENAITLLTRNKNGMPAMLLYDYYKGKVLVTSVYDDWAYFDGASTRQGELLVRDMIAWAENPNNVDNVLNSNSIEIPVDINNRGDYNATNISYTLIDPLGKVITEKTETLSPYLSAGENISKNFTHTFTSDKTVGIWSIDYTLQNDTDLIYPEYDAKKVAIGNFVSSKNGYSSTPSITYSISSTNDHFAYGSDAVFTVTVWNNGDTDKNLTLKYCFPHNGWIEGDPQYGIGNDGSWYNLEKTIDVPAHSSASFNHVLNNVRSFDRFWSSLYDNSNGLGISSSTYGFYTFTPSVKIEFNSQDTFKVNTTNTLNFSVKPTKGDISAKVSVKIFDSSSYLVNSTVTNVNMSKNSPYNGSMMFNPQKDGTFNFVVEIVSGSNRLGTNSLYIRTVDRLVSLDVADNAENFKFYETNLRQLIIKNLEDTSANDLVLNTIYTDPKGIIQWTNSTSLQMDAMEVKEINVSVPIGNASFGKHVISYKIYGNDTVLDQEDISFNYNPKVRAYLSNSVLIPKSNETLTVSLVNSNVVNTLILDINSTALGLLNNTKISMQPGEQKTIKYNIEVPELLLVGGHISINVYASEDAANLKDSPISNIVSYRVGDSKLITSVMNPEVVAGSNLTFNITNMGPSDTNVDYSLYLFSNKYDTVTVLNTTTVSIDIPVPYVSTGNYTLSGKIYNMGTGRSDYIGIPIHVNGYELDMVMDAKTVNAGGSLPVTLNNSGSLDTVVNVKAVLRSGGTVYTSRKIASVEAGKSNVLDIPISDDMISGGYSLYLEYSNDSINLYKYKYYYVQINGIELDFNLDRYDYNAGQNIGVTVDNTGGIDADYNISVTLRSIDLGTKQSATSSGDSSNLMFTIPENTQTGYHSVHVSCYEKNTGRTLKYSSTIRVSGIEYELAIDTLTAKWDETINASVKNTGPVTVSGTYNLTLSNTTHIFKTNNGSATISAGSSETFSLTVPQNLASGNYQFSISFEDQTGNENSASGYVTVPDPTFEFNTDNKTYDQNDIINATLGNITGITNGSFNLILSDQSGIVIAQNQIQQNVSNNSVTLNLTIPSGILTGRYSANVKATNLINGDVSDAGTDVHINGLSITNKIQTDKNNYFHDEPVEYTTILRSTGGTPSGNVSIAAYLQEPGAQNLLLKSKYPVNSIVRIGDIIWVGTNNGLMVKDGSSELTAVSNAELSSMTIAAMDVAGTTLWIRSDSAVYKYETPTRQLTKIVDLDGSGEYQGEGGGGILRVDATNNKIYLPAAWNGITVYDYVSGITTQYNYSNSQLNEVTEIIVLPDEVLFNVMDYTNGNTIHSLSNSNEWSVYNTSDGLPCDTFESVVSDDSYVYFISDSNISSMNINSRNISTYEFTPDIFVNGVSGAVAYDGVVWLWSNGNLTSYNRATDEMSTTVIFSNPTTIAIAPSVLWIGGSDGLFTYDPSTQTQTEISLNSFSGDTVDIARDSTHVVRLSNSGDVIEIYDIDADAWTEVTVDVGNSAKLSLTDDYAWVASASNLTRMDRISMDIVLFNSTNNYVQTNPIEIISVNDDLWVIETNGISIYTTDNGIANSSISGMPTFVSSLKDITSYGSIVSILDNGGNIYQYDYGSDSWNSYSTGIELSLRIADNGKYWIATSFDVYSYDTGTNSTVVVSDYDSSDLAAIGNDVYMVQNYILYVFNTIENKWSELNSSNSIIPGYIDGIKSNENYLQIYGNNYGDIWIASLDSKATKTVLDITVDLSTFTNTTDGVFTILSRTDTLVTGQNGQLSFVVKPVTSIGQVISSNDTAVDVYTKDVGIVVTTEHEYYKPGENISITGSVSNNAQIPVDTDVVLLNGSFELYNETHHLNAFETLKFNSSLSSPVSFTLTGKAGLKTVTKDIYVESAIVNFSLMAPDMVDANTFILGITATNTGNVTANIDVSINNVTIDTDSFSISLEPGMSKALELNSTIRDNATIDVTISGDVSDRVTKFVELGERAAMESDCQTLYRPRDVEIPVMINNTGKYNSEFTVTYAVNTTTMTTRTYNLGINQSINDTLTFALGKGTYTFEAAADIPLEFNSIPFTVDEIVILELIKLDMQPGNATLNVNVTNKHPQLAFNGTIRIETDFFTQSYLMNLSPNELKNIDYTMPLRHLAVGNYTVTMELIEGNTVLQTANSTLIIEAPIFSVTPDPANKVTLNVDESFVHNFTVKNTGSIEGEALLTLDIPGIHESSRSEWINPNESKNFSFSFYVPDDLQEGNYSAYYRFNEAEPQETKLYIMGANITVVSSLDRRAYLAGETATLTMEVDNNGAQELQLYSRIKYLDFDNVTYYNASANGKSTFTMDIPINETENKLFISVYIGKENESGRSLYINSDYIHDRRDVNGLIISTEKQAYGIGETVTMNANITRPDRLSDRLIISGPGLDYNNTINENTTITSSAIPNIPAGVYAYYVTYGNVSSTYLLDIHGFEMIVIYANLNEGMRGE